MSNISSEANRKDFGTDTEPTLFIDNWGMDVVTKYAEKTKRQIEAAVALAQLMSSIRNSTAVDPNTLDTSTLKGIAFFDGSDEQDDHFFAVDLDPRYTQGSYRGPRVSVTFDKGFVRRESTWEDGTVYAAYDEKWSTRRGDVISGRPIYFFDQDLDRLNNAISTLDGVPIDRLPTSRPETWPNPPSNNDAYQAGIRSLRIVRESVYLGSTPINLAHEPFRQVRIPFL